MKNLLLHPRPRKQLEQFIKQPSHTVALVGEAGAGKGTIARGLAAAILSISAEKLETHPYFHTYKPKDGSISIETAREIAGLIRLKTTGGNAIRRIVVIEDAQTMTTEAQNALLKTFEEPPVDTLFILTITSTVQVLPTILSRFQTISLQPAGQAASIEYFSAAGFQQAAITQYYYMSDGLTGLLCTLLSDSEHPLGQHIQKAKTILQADSFERLTMVDDITKQKQAYDIVTALHTISRSALYVEASRENTSKASLKRWATVLEKTEKAKGLLHQNVQPKLVLTSLFLEI